MRLEIACLGTYNHLNYRFLLLTWRLGTRYTANNFNAPMAKNAKLTIVEVRSCFDSMAFG